MKKEINHSWTIRNPKQIEKIKKFLNDEEVKNDSSLYEVSMYE